MRSKRRDSTSDAGVSFISVQLYRNKNYIVFNRKEEEDTLSVTSTVTLTQPDTSTSKNESNEMVSSSLRSSPLSHKDMVRTSSVQSEKDNFKEKDDKDSVTSRRYSNGSTATLTNVRTPTNSNSKSDPVRYYFYLVLSQYTITL